MKHGVGAFAGNVDVVSKRRGLHANRLCAILTGNHIVEEKKGHVGIDSEKEWARTLRFL